MSVAEKPSLEEARAISADFREANDQRLTEACLVITHQSPNATERAEAQDLLALIQEEQR